MDKKNEYVICPHCGYRMPVLYNESAFSNGLSIKCKGRHCKKKFEIIIENGKQIK